MNFKEAYKAMQEGKKVRRKGWSGYFFYSPIMNRIFQFVDENQFKPPVDEIALENALAEDWEVVEEKKKYWKPKESERYYFIDAYQEGIGNDTNDGTDVDDFRLSIGNYFKTKEEAEHMVEKLKVIHELQKFAYENNERENDWNNFSQTKFYLIYDSEVNNILVDYSSCTRTHPFNIYFTSFKIAKRAIEAVGEDRIKKYYFDVEE